ncbi:MAG: acyltransferase [Candidatus Methanoperedens sp.]|nr:acyltransferase [Candidatus Methanoperedens sp.]
MIGDATIIAGQCYISAENHIHTTGNYIRFQGEKTIGIHIGSGAWIGGGVMILDGVSVGDGSVIGAGSIVTHNIPPNMICYGNPCEVIRERRSWISNEKIK